jgi:hypothetical protein
VTVKCNSDRSAINELVDSLVIGEIIGFKEMMDMLHIRQLTRPIDLTAIDGLYFYDPIRIPQGKGKWRTVEINNHTGNGCINICSDTVFVPEYHAGIRITIISEFIIPKQYMRADTLRDFNPPVGDRD